MRYNFTYRHIVIFLCLSIFMTTDMQASDKASQKKSFSLEDLNFGGTNYKNMRPANVKYHWEGDVLKEGANTKKHEDTRFEIRNHNAFVDGNQITADGCRDIVYGQVVYRNEFGVERGVFWSNNRKMVAFYRLDQSKVADYPQVDYNGRIATLVPDKYPMAGEASQNVTIGVYDTQTKKLTYLQTGDGTDRYFTNICWSPDDRKIYLMELNRDQTDMTLDEYDAVSGKKLRTLYSEHDDKYTEPEHPITFLPWDDSMFILQSQKEGYNSLYLFKLTSQDCRLVKNLKKDDFIVTDMYGFCKENNTIIIRAAKSNEMNYDLYKININTAKWTKLTKTYGYHIGLLSKSGKYLLDNYSAPDIPRCIEVINTVTGKRESKFMAKDPWNDYAQPIFKSGTIKSADGNTDLFYRMVLPPDFNPKKKYPTVVYVYGGPHARSVTASWHFGYRGWEPYMAQKGFVVFILDNRGSADRGKDFEQITFRHLGQEEMKDQMKGVEFLKSLPFVDADRLGIHGWSFGGFMTISLMLNHPDIFKVGVAGGPVIDWKYYEVMYGERYMDTPQMNPDGYKQTSLLDNKSSNLNGKLLIIIGANDNTVLPQHSYLFLKEAIDNNKSIDFFAYPEEEHNMKGHRSVHLHEKITDYFTDYLKP